MNRQKIGFGLAGLALLASAGYWGWRQTGGIRRASANPAIAEASPTFELPRLGFSPGPPPVPRIVATWASRVESFSVCVSHVRPMQDSRRMLGRGGFQVGQGGFGPFHLTLQIMGEEPEIKAVTLDVDSVRLTDETGQELRLDPAAPNADAPVEFEGGLGYVLPFPAPNPRASMLRAVIGDVVLASGEKRRFQIQNVALPLARLPRLFGRMAPRRLARSDESSLPDRLVVLQGEAAESALSRSLPVEGVLTVNPQRLVFAEGIAATVGIPTPVEPGGVRMTATSGQMGLMNLEIAYGAESWRGKLWEQDVVMVVLPRVGNEPRRASAVRLTRFSGGSTPQTAVSPPFMPAPGQPGGAIAGAVLVDGRPFGQGVQQVELRQRQGVEWSESRVVNVYLDRGGAFEIANLAPGVYSLRRPGARVTPETPPRDVAPLLASYLRGRFGVHSGKWEAEEVGEIVVRSGQRTEIAPLNYRPEPVKPR